MIHATPRRLSQLFLRPQSPVAPVPAVPLVPLLCFLYSALAGAPPASGADLDLVFLIDTTSSMAGEILEAKERVHQLADALAETRKGQRIRAGVVAYRDRGDAYVTLVSPLDEKIETSFNFLAALEAAGGGDGPEDVLAGLAAAIRRSAWSPGEDVERQIFLIGDAPPHLDYRDGPRPEELIEEARRSRIVVNTIGCRSLSTEGVELFRMLAYATEGRYQHIGRVRADEPSLGDALLRAVVPASGEIEAVAEGGIPLRARLERETAEAPAGGLFARLVVAPAHSAGGQQSQGAGTTGAASSRDGAETVPSSPAEEPEAAGPGFTRAGVSGPGVTRAGVSGSGVAGLGACFLEVLLPDGIRLEGGPRLTLGSKSLEVEIDIGSGGSGGSLLYALEPCVPAPTPVRVSFGG